MIHFERVKADSDVRLPHRAHEHDAAFDVYSNEDRMLPVGEWHRFLSGWKMSLPAGFVAMVLPRSGLALDHGLTVLNSPGLADPNFRGELGVILINHGKRAYTVKRFDRIAQLLVVKFIEAMCSEDTLWPQPDHRGEGGFGSTGR